MIYIFVEGNDDNNLIDEIIKGKDGFKVIQYAEKKKEKIEGLIRSFDKMGEEYIFLADLDEKDEEIRKGEMKKKYSNIKCEKIYFSIQEIEAWYLAGISDNNKRKYRVKDTMLLNTENITKEKFEKLFNNRRETLLQIKLNILADFNFEKAKSRNNSSKDVSLQFSILSESFDIGDVSFCS